MARIVEVEPGDVLVFSNIGFVDQDTVKALGNVIKHLHVKFAIFEGDVDISVVREVAIEAGGDDAVAGA
jgi:hypothetical protein